MFPSILWQPCACYRQSMKLTNRIAAFQKIEKDGSEGDRRSSKRSYIRRSQWSFTDGWNLQQHWGRQLGSDGSRKLFSGCGLGVKRTLYEIILKFSLFSSWFWIIRWITWSVLYRWRVQRGAGRIIFENWLYSMHFRSKITRNYWLYASAVKKMTRRTPETSQFEGFFSKKTQNTFESLSSFAWVHLPGEDDRTLSLLWIRHYGRVNFT